LRLLGLAWHHPAMVCDGKRDIQRLLTDLSVPLADLTRQDDELTAVATQLSHELADLAC
jgi:hypothetical protein